MGAKNKTDLDKFVELFHNQGIMVKPIFNPNDGKCYFDIDSTTEDKNDKVFCIGHIEVIFNFNKDGSFDTMEISSYG